MEKAESPGDPYRYECHSAGNKCYRGNKVIKEIDHEKVTEIIFSGLIQREDHDFRDQIEEIIGKLKRYCDSKGYRFVENSNINENFLNRDKLYLNKKGTLLLCRDIANVLRHIWYASNGDFLLLLFKNYKLAGKSMTLRITPALKTLLTNPSTLLLISFGSSFQVLIVRK